MVSTIVVRLRRLLHKAAVATAAMESLVVPTRRPVPGILLLVQFRNEREGLPAFFSNVLPHIDGIIGLNDGSEDGSGDYFQAQPKVLRVIHRPIRTPHRWDEPGNRLALMQAASHFRPKWILALDVDERLEQDFRVKVQAYLVAAERLNCHSISQPLREIWDSPDTYRCDGIWDKKRRERLFRWTEDHHVDPSAFHGTWTSVRQNSAARSADQQNKGRTPLIRGRHSIACPLPIYHLGMLTDTMRTHRVQKYERLDPAHQFQSIGYAYLNDTNGLRLRHVDSKRPYRHSKEVFPIPIPGVYGQADFQRAFTHCIEFVRTNMALFRIPPQDGDQIHESMQRLERWLKQCVGHLRLTRNPLAVLRPSSVFALSTHPTPTKGNGQYRAGYDQPVSALHRTQLNGEAVSRSVVVVGPQIDCQNILIGRLCRNRGYRLLTLNPVVDLISTLEDISFRHTFSRLLWQTLIRQYPSGVVFQITDTSFSKMVTTPGDLSLPQILVRECRVTQTSVYWLGSAGQGNHRDRASALVPRTVIRLPVRDDQCLDELIRLQAVIEQRECSPFFQGVGERARSRRDRETGRNPGVQDVQCIQDTLEIRDVREHLTRSG